MMSLSCSYEQAPSPIPTPTPMAVAQGSGSDETNVKIPPPAQLPPPQGGHDGDVVMAEQNYPPSMTVNASDGSARYGESASYEQADSGAPSHWQRSGTGGLVSTCIRNDSRLYLDNLYVIDKVDTCKFSGEST